MHNHTGGRDDPTFQSIDSQLIEQCRKHTHLSDEDIQILLETSHNLDVVHRLEGGDVFIDCITESGDAAVVVAQYSPIDTNYTRLIVGELMIPQNEPGVFRTLQIGVPSRKLKAVVTGNYLIRQNVSPIYGTKGNVIGVLILERHIQSEELWDEKEEKSKSSASLQAIYDAKEMEHIAECMTDGMVRFNKRGIAAYANPSACNLYRDMNYMDDVVGMPFENLAFGNISFQDVRKYGQSEHKEVKINAYILNVVYTPLFDDEKFTGVVMMIEDQTEEKNIEKELVLKSAAIDEIHHRVKNNLQTIISLLRMQSRRLQDANARQAFAEAISRVFSIAMTHEILAQKGVGSVELKDMLSRMLNSARGYIIPEALDLTIKITGDTIVLNSEITTSIAMVVNELVQNSIKHAFVEREEGTILLRIQKGNPKSHIEVIDDGVGFQTSVIRQGSLGHKLVRSLVEEKLKGEIQISSSEKGTHVMFEFNNDPSKAYSKAKIKSVEKMMAE